MQPTGCIKISIKISSMKHRQNFFIFQLCEAIQKYSSSGYAASLPRILNALNWLNHVTVMAIAAPKLLLRIFRMYCSLWLRAVGWFNYTRSRTEWVFQQQVHKNTGSTAYSKIRNSVIIWSQRPITAMIHVLAWLHWTCFEYYHCLDEIA